MTGRTVKGVNVSIKRHSGYEWSIRFAISAPVIAKAMFREGDKLNLEISGNSAFLRPAKNGGCKLYHNHSPRQIYEIEFACPPCLKRQNVPADRCSYGVARGRIRVVLPRQFETINHSSRPPRDDGARSPQASVKAGSAPPSPAEPAPVSPRAAASECGSSLGRPVQRRPKLIGGRCSLMIPAAVPSHYDQSGLSGGSQAANNFLRNVRNASHAAEPSDGGETLHYGTLSKTLGERVSAALTRRLFPYTNLTRKQLQHALGISAGTMDNLLSGHHDPSGRVLDKLVGFFRESFINEIWGANNIHCIDTRAPEKAVLVAQMVTAQAELRRLG